MMMRQKRGPPPLPLSPPPPPPPLSPPPPSPPPPTLYFNMLLDALTSFQQDLHATTTTEECTGKRRNSLWDRFTICGAAYEQGHGQGPWTCKFCNELKSGLLKRLIAHVGRVPGEEIEFFSDYHHCEPPQKDGLAICTANAQYVNIKGEIFKTPFRRSASATCPPIVTHVTSSFPLGSNAPSQQSLAATMDSAASNDNNAADAQTGQALSGGLSSRQQRSNMSGPMNSSGGMQLGLGMAAGRQQSLHTTWQNRSYIDADVVVRRFIY
ncbi:hypothetical protein SELMODRAFT_408701 [Selaginella moellendorffii]|uniref:Uncharacterized protein n=1 Tax=Selaginella moellendorffii TaxID=88036 RepID=D8R9P1_SELML|nr:hypothetical protein SELMODRAFT_408701 [Selaginella moellendorffii]